MSGRTRITSPPERPAGPVPLPLTPLIGRVREIKAVQQLLSANRLVTLTGPGGCGKSRLAIAIASLPEAGAVAWIPLAALADSTLIADRVAVGIGLRGRPHQAARDAVLEALRDAELTVVLDNCEHVVEDCVELVELLLSHCPRLCILATSRESLGVVGERRFPVPPLVVPDPRNPPPIENLVKYDSVRLFAERASAAEPSFSVTAENAAAVASVCARLDGIPLALELAAARTSTLTIDEICSRLRSSFDLLIASGRSVLPQQRTIRATIDWSVRLLPDAERSVLCRLAVFTGGFTLDAAEAVAVETPGADGARSGEVLDLVARLVDRSLILVDREAGRSRYYMLETVRQYGTEQLAADELMAARQRHAAHFVRAVSAAEPSLRSGQRRSTLQLLGADHDNLNAALSFTAEASPRDHLRLAGNLFFYWFMAGHLREGRRWFECALVRGANVDGDPTALARTLSGAGFLAWTAGEFDSAADRLERAIEIFRAAADDAGLAQALRFLSGNCESIDDLARARALVEESVALARRAGDPFNLAMGLSRLGITAASQHHFDEAFPALEESLAISRRADDGWATALTLRHLGIACLRAGKYERALAALRESLELLRATDDRILAVQSLETVAAVRAAQGDHRTAALLLGALAEHRDSFGLSVIYSGDLDRALTATRAGLSEDEFSKLRAEGAQFSFEDMYSLALLSGASGDGTAVSSAAGLTPREQEILRLIARGMTNDQAARALFVSSRTINWHLTAIYAKLGVRSRTEATRFALDHGIR